MFVDNTNTKCLTYENKRNREGNTNMHTKNMMNAVITAKDEKRMDVFLNRRITPMKAVCELLGFTAFMAVWVLACAI